jgi:hypothetical protein
MELHQEPEAFPAATLGCFDVSVLVIQALLAFRRCKRALWWIYWKIAKILFLGKGGALSGKKKAPDPEIGGFLLERTRGVRA